MNPIFIVSAVPRRGCQKKTQETNLKKSSKRARPIIRKFLESTLNDEK